MYLSIWTRDLSRGNLTSVMVIMLSGREDMTEISGVEMADVGDVVVDPDDGVERPPSPRPEPVVPQPGGSTKTSDDAKASGRKPCLATV